jgi:dTDP-4-dehydrorhamnose 3,5-epimerase-like enzyme
MILRPVLDHYPAVRPPDSPFVPPLNPGREVPGISGARLLTISAHVDPRGALAELWREGQDGPAAQAYISITRPNTVKGWHLHCMPGGLATDPVPTGAIQVDRFVLLRGRIRVGLVDLRGYDGSLWRGLETLRPSEFTHETGIPSAEVELDAGLGFSRLDIPPGVAHGWIALGSDDAHVLNLVSRAYDGTQERRCDPHGPVAPGLPAWDWRARRDG